MGLNGVVKGGREIRRGWGSIKGEMRRRVRKGKNDFILMRLQIMTVALDQAKV